MELPYCEARHSGWSSWVEEKYCDFAFLPVTHEHILKAILLYCDAVTLRTCEDVCPTWSCWISSSRIWTRMLAVERARAVSLARSIRCCIPGAGVGWWNDVGCDFVLHRLEHLAQSAKEMAKQNKYNQEMVKKKALNIRIFIENTWKIIMAENYQELLLKLLYKEEKKGSPQVQSLPRELRSSLIDWIFDIGGEYVFKTETVHQVV